MIPNLEHIFPPLHLTQEEAVLRLTAMAAGISGVVAAIAIIIFSTLPLLGPLLLISISATLFIGGAVNSKSLMVTPTIVAMAVLVAFPMTVFCPGFV